MPLDDAVVPNLRKREIARGSQGIVYKADIEVIGRCPVKKYPVSISRQGEVCTLHEDVNYYRDVIRNDTTHTALRDNMKRELKYTQLVMEKDPSHFTEKNIVHCALGIARALASCHEDFSIIHRDKEFSVLLTSDIGGMRTAKLSDFGYARKNENNQGMMTSNKGNIMYRAPEMMFVYFMAFRRTPFEAEVVYSKNYSHQRHRENLQSQDPKARPNLKDWPLRDDGSDVHSYYFMSEILTIIKNGWETNPKDRPDMLQIMRHLIMMATDGKLQDN